MASCDMGRWNARSKALKTSILYQLMLLLLASLLSPWIAVFGLYVLYAHSAMRLCEPFCNTKYVNEASKHCPVFNLAQTPGYYPNSSLIKRPCLEI
jgi:hypothetical protein